MLLCRTVESVADLIFSHHRDPQIAAIYYAQIMQHGKDHYQGICACATHLLDRIWTILKEDRPYELRDVDGTR